MLNGAKKPASSATAEAVVSLFVGAYLGELVRHGLVDDRWLDRCLDLMWAALVAPGD